MTRTEHKNWAKVEIIRALDFHLIDLFADPDPISGAPDLVDRVALLKQRNRVVRFLAYGNPKTLKDFSSPTREL